MTSQLLGSVLLMSCQEEQHKLVLIKSVDSKLDSNYFAGVPEAVIIFHSDSVLGVAEYETRPVHLTMNASHSYQH